MISGFSQMVLREITGGIINMTRFQIAVIKDGVIYTSTEFNGDGYWEGHGETVYAALQNITTVEEWKEYVTKFNSETFNYDEELHYEIDDEYDDYLDMNKDYFKKWFSDYIYILRILVKTKLSLLQRTAQQFLYRMMWQYSTLEKDWYPAQTISMNALKNILYLVPS